MKAVIVREHGEPSGLSYETMDDPVPTGRHVLVKVHACGVCRRDLLVRRAPPTRELHSPLVLGHEIAGEVVGLGPRARGFQIGDRVVSTQREYVCGHCTKCRTDRETLCADLRFLGNQAMGGYAELVLVNDDNLCQLPEGVDYVAASIVGCPVGTAYNAVCDTGLVRIGERVLVTGMGGVGTHAVQIAKAVGAFVIATTRDGRKAAMLKELGADAVVVAPDGEFAKAVREASGAGGVDVVIDTVGGPAFQQALRAVVLGGRIVLVGDVTGKPVEVKMTSIYRRGLEIRSAVSTSRRQLQMALRMVAAGQIRPLVAKTLPLSEAAEAHRISESDELMGRVVLIP